MKAKKKTRGKLVKELDLRFSRYIRLKYADKKGICECYTCGDRAHWKELQNGHFISRSNYKYRRDESNCRCQCVRCNIFYSGNYKSYTLNMIKELGESKVKDMVEDKELGKISTPWIEEMIQYYKNIVNNYK